MERTISLLSDQELLAAINENKCWYSLEALGYIEKEIDKRKKFYDTYQKIVIKASKYKDHMITASTDLRSRGFHKATDPLRSFIVLTLAPIVIFLIAWMVGMVLQNREKNLPDEIAYVMVTAFIIAFLSSLYYLYHLRRCPICKNKMIKLEPEQNDKESTYKFICYPCRIYVDTLNKRGDGLAFEV